MQMSSIADLVLDFDLYPRHDVDAHQVAELVEAFQADESIPAIVACKKTKKVIDGFHRVKALLRMYGKDAKWYIKWEDFSNDKDRFMRAVQLNARHGKKLSRYDRAHCAVIAEKLRISTADLAAGFGCTKDSFTESVKDRFAANSATNSLKAPLKRPLRHFAEKTLTKRQWQANEKLSGWDAKFHADQLIEMIDADVLNKEDQALFDKLKHLHEKLETILVAN